MHLKTAIVLFTSISLFFHGCAPTRNPGISAAQRQSVEKAYRQVDDRRFAPYTILNTIEGYRQFIDRYPDNLNIEAAKIRIATLAFDRHADKDTIAGVQQFLETYPHCRVARKRLAHLQYAPYEEQNTRAGYQAFIEKHPDNYWVAAARRNLATLAYKSAEQKDTVAAYREFLNQYPDSNNECEARARIHEIEFRQLNSAFMATYDFDLMLYRLQIKRCQRELQRIGKDSLADFELSASRVEFNGDKYFQTVFIYRNDPPPMAVASADTSHAWFDGMVSESIIYLNSRFKKKHMIDGFSFQIAASPFGFCKGREVFADYYFPMGLVDRYARHLISKEEFLAGSEVKHRERISTPARKKQLPPFF